MAGMFIALTASEVPTELPLCEEGVAASSWAERLFAPAPLRPCLAPLTRLHF